LESAFCGIEREEEIDGGITSSLARRARRRRERKRKTEMAPVRRRLVAVWSGVGLSSVEKSVGARSSTGPSPSASTVPASGAGSAAEEGGGGGGGGGASGSACIAVGRRPVRGKEEARGRRRVGERRWR
jgi:hypothetical protein